MHRPTAVAVGLLLILALGCITGARFNVTASLPKGLYWVVKEQISRDAYIRFCPPAQGAFAEAMRRGYLHEGNCPSGYRPLMKRVSGVAGDSVTVERTAVRINGARLPLSAQKGFDSFYRPMPRPDQSRYVLASSQLWAMSDTNPNSFDSRYFGPIDQKWVIEVVRPVVTWGYGSALIHSKKWIRSD